MIPRGPAHRAGAGASIVAVVSVVALAAGCTAQPSTTASPFTPAVRSAATTPTPGATPSVVYSPITELEPPPGYVVRLIETDAQFLPAHLVIAVYQTLVITNVGSEPHTFSIAKTPVDVTTPPGQTTNLGTVGSLLAQGSYQFTDPALAGEGMIGVITVLDVTPSPPP